MLYAALGSIRTGGVICEIGVHKGQNAEVMARHLRPVLFYLIDPWDGSCLRRTLDWDAVMAQARKRLYDVGAADACMWLRKRSDVATGDIPERSIDFIYIDGDHHCEAVWKDIQAYWPKVRVGGVMAGHEWDTCRVTNCVTPPVVRTFGDAVRAVGSDSWCVVKREDTAIVTEPPDAWHRKPYRRWVAKPLTFGEL
jgi:hypothetical protein